MPTLLTLFWFIRTTKFVFFYIYLWQLKEYHIGRFFDHFQTEKGKKLLLNPLYFLKVILLILFFAFPYSSSYFPAYFTFFFNLYSLFPSFLLILYFAESLRVLKDLFWKKLKFPTFTKKTIFLSLVLLSAETLLIFFLFTYEKDINFFAISLLTADIFILFLASCLILLFQPLTVFFRNINVQRAKKRRNGLKNLLVIGITGSYGKTSTKEFLYTILSQKFNVVKTKEHQNSEAGIAQCILNDLKEKHEIFIVEMGAYGRGGIKLLSDIAKPKIGILTGINEQHLALFGSQENIIRAKYELIESLPKDGLAIFNGDDPRCFTLYQNTDRAKRIFSAQRSAFNVQPDLWAENIIAQKDFVFFKVCDKVGCGKFRAYIAGAHFIPNLLAAILVAREVGMSFEEISQAMLKIRPIKKTMQVLEGINRLTIIDDSYSANPHGVFSALNYLKTYPSKKVIILPCLIELGAASKKIHKRIGEEIGKVCNTAIVTTKERFQEIKEGVFQLPRFRKENIVFLEDPEEIFSAIKSFCDPGDVVLLEGRVPKKLIELLV